MQSDVAPRGRTRIAVLNDDTTFLQVLTELLTDEGYEVRAHVEWEGAYELVRDWQPDLVVLDLAANAEQRGWTLLELLRLDPKTRPIPVILCSASRDQLQQKTDRLRQLDAEPLEKPFDLQQLLDCIGVLLARRETGAGGGG